MYVYVCICMYVYICVHVRVVYLYTWSCNSEYQPLKVYYDFDLSLIYYQFIPLCNKH